MILQYSSNEIECYEQAQSICIFTVPIKEEYITDVMKEAEEKLERVWGKPVFEIREEQYFFPNSKIVKIAILNERERHKSRALMFSENTVLYLLNDNGKTLKMF